MSAARPRYGIDAGVGDAVEGAIDAGEEAQLLPEVPHAEDRGHRHGLVRALRRLPLLRRVLDAVAAPGALESDERVEGGAIRRIRAILGVGVELDDELLRRQERDREHRLLALVRLAPLAGAVAQHRVGDEPAVGHLPFVGDAEVARAAEAVEVERRLLDGAVAPEALDALEGGRGRDAEVELVALVLPGHVRVLDERRHPRAALEVPGAVDLQAETGRPRRGEGEVEGQVAAPQPEAPLVVDRPGRGG